MFVLGSGRFCAEPPAQVVAGDGAAQPVADYPGAEGGLQGKEQRGDFAAGRLDQRREPRLVVRRQLADGLLGLPIRAAEGLARLAVGAGRGRRRKPQRQGAEQEHGDDQQPVLLLHARLLREANSGRWRSSSALKRVSALTTSTVSSPSLMASGICVMAKMPPNLSSEAVKPPAGSGKAQASGRLVVR